MIKIKYYQNGSLAYRRHFDEVRSALDYQTVTMLLVQQGVAQQFHRPTLRRSFFAFRWNPSSHNLQRVQFNQPYYRSFGKRRKGKGKVQYNTPPPPKLRTELPPPSPPEKPIPLPEYIESLNNRRLERIYSLNPEEARLWKNLYRNRKDHSPQHSKLLHLFSCAVDAPSITRLRRELEFQDYIPTAIYVLVHHEVPMMSPVDDDDGFFEQARLYRHANTLAVEKLYPPDWRSGKYYLRLASRAYRQAFLYRAQQEQHPLKAIAHYQAALEHCVTTSSKEVNTDAIPVLESLGAALIETGRVAEGLEQYETALQYAEEFAEHIVKEQVFRPDQADVVTELAPTLVRLRERVRDTTELLQSRENGQ